jgi:regulator of protease activity HflC (stomatin/prohibitin superfamily)
MEFIIFIALIFALILALVGASTIRRCVIFEYQRGLLFRHGKFISILEPGQHWYIRSQQSIQVIDVRNQSVTIPGQEVLTADNIGIKISLIASYKIVDPYRAITQFMNYREAFYLQLQAALRDIVGALAVDDLLATREEIGKTLFERTREKATEVGIEPIEVNIKDIMFSGDLKKVFAQVVNARKEGLAALERARGESAALRNLANAARLLDDNPNLWQLRLLQLLENTSGNTVVLMPKEGLAGLKTLADKNA